MKFVSKPSPKHERIFDDFKCGKGRETERGKGDPFFKFMNISYLFRNGSEEFRRARGNIFITV